MHPLLVFYLLLFLHVLLPAYIHAPHPALCSPKAVLFFFCMVFLVLFPLQSPSPLARLSSVYIHFPYPATSPVTSIEAVLLHDYFVLLKTHWTPLLTLLQTLKAILLYTTLHIWSFFCSCRGCLASVQVSIIVHPGRPSVSALLPLGSLFNHKKYVFEALMVDGLCEFAVATGPGTRSIMLLYNCLQKSSGRLVGDLSVRASAGMLPRRIVLHY